MKKKIAIGAASVLAAGAAAAGIAVAGGGDDNEAPIKGSALDKASEAALEETAAAPSPRPRPATRRATTRSR